MSPEFIAGEAGDAPIESICHSAWNGIRRGDSRVDSTNRTHFLLPLAADRPGAVECAFAALVARHPILACRVAERGGRPWLVSGAAPPIEAVGAVRRAEGGGRHATEQAIGAIVWRLFAVDRDALSRPFVVRLGNDAAWFGLVVHHFVADAFSVGILRGDFQRLHRAVVAGTTLPPSVPDVRYQDYLYGLHRWIGSDAGRARRTAVAGRVAEFPHLAFVATDPAVSEERFQFDPAVAAQVGTLARALRTTSYTVLLAAQAAVLGAMTDGGRIAMKIITSGRDSSAVVRTVGNLADRQFLLIDVQGNPSFVDLVDRAKGALAVCRRDAFVRSDFVQADLSARGVNVAAPVVNYRLQRQPPDTRPYRRSALQVPAVEPGSRTLPRDAYYLELTEYPGGLSGTIRYGAGRIAGLLSWFERFLAAACHAPDEPCSVLLRRSEPRD